MLDDVGCHPFINRGQVAFIGDFFHKAPVYGFVPFGWAAVCL